MKSNCTLRSFEMFESSGNDEQKRWCPLCGSHEQIERSDYSLPPWRIVACEKCRFVYLANPVSYGDLADTHAWEKNIVQEAVRRSNDRPILDRFSKGTRWRLHLFGRNRDKIFLKLFQKGRVLNIGCGSDTTLPAPLVPFGVEISRYLAEQANLGMEACGGSCVHAPAIEGIGSFDSKFFDGVILRSFLEHETNPLPLLREVHRVLADDGVVYVRVPNFSSVNRRVMARKWCGFRYPDHVNYFTPSSLSQMANIAGFDLRIQRRIILAFDDNIKAVLKKSDTNW